MAGAFPVVKGTKARFTKINSCGLPQAGPGNRLVTDGYVAVNLSPVMKDAEELEQANAEGRICVADRTPPERKWWTVEIEFCKVDPDAFTMLTSWEKVLDHNDQAIGFRDQEAVDSDYGVAIEVWTTGKGDDDCPIPTLDTVFSQTGSGRQYGYLLLGAVEFTLGDFSIAAAVATFTLSGITVAMPHWGRGPYNVAGTDDLGTPGRLLVPTSKKEHITMFRTPVAPPEVTDGAVALDISGVFIAPDYYFGGPANAPAADVAPEQPATESGGELTITGVPDGGDFTLDVTYTDQPDQPTSVLTFDVDAATLEAALVAIDDGYGASDWTVTGTAMPAGVLTIVGPPGVVVTPGTNGLTGGTAPTVHVDY